MHNILCNSTCTTVCRMQDDDCSTAIVAQCYRRPLLFIGRQHNYGYTPATVECDVTSVSYVEGTEVSKTLQWSFIDHLIVTTLPSWGLFRGQVVNVLDCAMSVLAIYRGPRF